MKLCREALNLTQESLVAELFAYNDLFKGLDTNTYSRWERGTTKPPLSKQVKILAYFFEKLNTFFPFLEMHNIELIEEKLSPAGMKKLLGKHQKLVMNFPSSQVDEDDFQIHLAKDSNHKDLAFSTSINISDDMYGTENYYTKEALEHFALNPNNLFLICEYNKQYFGHIFLLRLKMPVYQKILQFQKDLLEIEDNDIAAATEQGAYFFVGMFTMNDKALSLLFIRLYADLILHQEHLSALGTVLSKEDVETMARNINMKKVGSQEELIAYSGSLKEILLNEQVIKILFSS